MDGGDFLTPVTLRQRLLEIGNVSAMVQGVYPSYANGGLLIGSADHRGGVGTGTGTFPYVLPDEYIIAGDIEPIGIWTNLCDYKYIHTQYKSEDFIPMEAVRRKPAVYPTNFKTDTFYMSCGRYTYNTEVRSGYYNGATGSVTNYNSNRGNSIEAFYVTDDYLTRYPGTLMMNLGIVTLPTTYSGIYVELILSKSSNFSDSAQWKYKNTLNNANQGEVTNISAWSRWNQVRATPGSTAPESISIVELIESTSARPGVNNLYVQAKYYGTPKTS